MKELYIDKYGANHYSFDRGLKSSSDVVIMSMRKTAVGWLIECTELEHWDLSKNTTFFWVANTAREAFNDCMHCMRYIERRRAILKRA